MRGEHSELKGGYYGSLYRIFILGGSDECTYGHNKAPLGADVDFGMAMETLGGRVLVDESRCMAAQEETILDFSGLDGLVFVGRMACSKDINDDFAGTSDLFLSG